ncbi:MAG: DUF481 domain-containing protein [Labilithrix sp.]|nr:DUF481 domain-containing protein [Labilithrix sp.]
MRVFSGALVFVALSFCRVPRAWAQINVERLRDDLRLSPALASLEGSFTGRTGNVESLVVGAGAMGAARWRRNSFFASTQADYARFGSETRVSKSFIHLRYDYDLLPWLAAEAFVQQQQDKFQRLNLRELIGTGPRFLIADERDVRVAYGMAYMLEYERIAVPAGAPDDPVVVAHRWSNYLTATWQMDSRVRLVGTTYLQPRFDAFGDFRVLFESALTTEIAKRLAVKVLVTVRYDSRPPTDVKPTDAEIKNSIVVTF